MGIGQKLQDFSGSVQNSAKNASISLAATILKVITAIMISLTVALIGQEVFAYETFAFSFVMIVISSAIWKLMQHWGLGAVLLFDLFCVLVATLLRMYILLAP